MTARSTHKLLRPYKSLIQSTALPAVQNSGLVFITALLHHYESEHFYERKL